MRSAPFATAFVALLSAPPAPHERCAPQHPRRLPRFSLLDVTVIPSRPPAAPRADRHAAREATASALTIGSFIGGLLPGLAGGWSEMPFDLWCRICDPWPEARWRAFWGPEAVLWIDLRGVPRTGVETTELLDEHGNVLLHATIDWGTQTRRRLLHPRRARASPRGWCPNSGRKTLDAISFSDVQTRF